jgi:hypothetical protein
MPAILYQLGVYVWEARRAGAAGVPQHGDISARL